ncbi:MAG: hypothetical protein LBP83_08680 [Dysgonamonadaceae bacterium]|jgi:hypothetical protein|nr:hypothetical protein [Dysgonamonadaceae bacterium]
MNIPTEPTRTLNSKLAMDETTANGKYTTAMHILTPDSVSQEDMETRRQNKTAFLHYPGK